MVKKNITSEELKTKTGFSANNNIFFKHWCKQYFLQTFYCPVPFAYLSREEFIVSHFITCSMFSLIFQAQGFQILIDF